MTPGVARLGDLTELGLDGRIKLTPPYGCARTADRDPLQPEMNCSCFTPSARSPFWFALLLAGILGMRTWRTRAGSVSSESRKPPDKPSEIRLAYITNGIASFWNVATAGVKAGEREFGVRFKW